MVIYYVDHPSHVSVVKSCTCVLLSELYMSMSIPALNKLLIILRLMRMIFINSSTSVYVFRVALKLITEACIGHWSRAEGFPAKTSL